MNADITANRHGGNPASSAAWERSHGRHANARDRIMELFVVAPNGLTSKEIAAVTGWAMNTFSGRLTELEAAGLIRGTGVRRMGAEVHEIVRQAQQWNLLEVA